MRLIYADTGESFDLDDLPLWIPTRQRRRNPTIKRLHDIQALTFHIIRIHEQDVLMELEVLGVEGHGVWCLGIVGGGINGVVCRGLGLRFVSVSDACEG